MKKLRISIFLFLLPSLLLAKTILFLGDSLTEGHGIKKKDAYPALIKKLFEKEGKNISVINGGVSGSTSASGLQRMNWYLKSKKPDILFLSLGANDGLRGFKIKETKKNLSKIIDMAKGKNIKVILGGMMMPPNYGEDYTKNFKKLYDDLHKEKKILFVPFLLEGIAREKKYNQSDGIHPNEKGHEKIAELIFKCLKDQV